MSKEAKYADSGQPWRNWRFFTFSFLLVFSCAYFSRAETVSVILASNAAPRVQFGAERLAAALKSVNLDSQIVRSENNTRRKIFLVASHDTALHHEGFKLDSTGGG